MTHSLFTFPPEYDFSSKVIMQRLVLARSRLAELKGCAYIIPNQAILINALSLQEAKDSSAIENIITTHDDMYKMTLSLSPTYASLTAKEVENYKSGLLLGFQAIQTWGIINHLIIQDIQKELEKNNAGYRRIPGTFIRNMNTGDIVHTPPQDHATILDLMNQLLVFMHADDDIDPLIKMALIHHQFESIHPFYDGNGRTWRIVNILYLIQQKLLDLPILYVSGYIIRTKSEYYRLLQDTREKNTWEAWILYMLDAIIDTSEHTIALIKDISSMMTEVKHELKKHCDFYSQDLVNLLFTHPYTKIDVVAKTLWVTRQTASKYLQKMVSIDLVSKHTLGKSLYFVHNALFERLKKL